MSGKADPQNSKVLYAEAATNLSDACDFIALHFEDDMRYENPLCTVVGSKALMQHLYLLYSLPGTSATSELEDVYHRQERFGTTSFIFTHQITWSLMDLQDRDGSVTPQSTTTINTAFQGSTPPSPTSPFLHARLRPVPSRHDGSTFFSDMFGKLWPPTLLRNLTTLNIKCNTHVHYNEQGKVVLLEDVVSLKDLFESIPVFGKVYALERRALAGELWTSLSCSCLSVFD